MLRQRVEQQHHRHRRLVGVKNLPAQLTLVRKQNLGIVMTRILAQEQERVGALVMAEQEVIAKADPAQLIHALLQIHGIVSKKKNAKEQERGGV